MSTHGASEAILSSLSIEILNLEKYFHLSILILLRSIRLHIMFLTQFDPLCEFETLNLQYQLPLSIFMLIREMCSYIVLLTRFYCPGTSQISEHALHEEGLQRQKGVGPSFLSEQG